MSEASPPQLDHFLARVSTSLEQHAFVQLVLSGYRGPEQDLGRIIVRPVVLRGEPSLSFVYRYATRDVTKNFSRVLGLDKLRHLLMQSFKNAHLHTLTEDTQLAVSKKGRVTLRVGSLSAGQADAPQRVHDQEHNREKLRLVDLSRPFLFQLGVTDAKQHVIPAMSRKWKQINRFLEVFAAAWGRSPLAQLDPTQPVRVVDFGAGKGYLTFALHDHLRSSLGLKAQVTGVELRADLVQLCKGLVQTLGLEGLRFEQGDVHSLEAEGIDVMVALHACDVATDYAIHRGLRAGASIIMCAPCCHKQIRPQLLSPHPLRPILQYGVHLGQEAEMLTDGLRAMLLQACGYDTQVFEFISLEHTSKNKMILAVKRGTPQPARERAEVLGQIDELKRFYGIREQCLEVLLRQDGLLG